MTPGNTFQPPPSDPRVLRVLEEYAAELEAGHTPCREEFLARAPEIAPVLNECFDALEFMRGAAPQLESTDSDLAALPGATPLGDFSLIREVGRGGMGVVYEAVQLSLGRRVALKVLPFAATLDARQLQRFQNEARAAAQLHHTHIVPIYGVGTERGVHYYAMQFIEGKSLAVLVHELRAASGLVQPEDASLRLEPTTAYPAGPPDRGQGSTSGARQRSTQPSASTTAHVRTVAELGVQAAEALDHAHQLGIVHRDVKPANLLLDGRGQLWVTDFGLAQVQSDARLTATGDVVGTLRYMSPEQALARRGVVDHRTDVYSLGATLYELLTLEPPFGGKDRQELVRQIADDEPVAPRRRNRTIPAELQTIVLKALAKNPAERYATAQEFADDLRRFLEDKPIRARPPNVAQRAVKLARRHRPLVFSSVASLSLLLTGLVAGVLVYADKQETAAREKEQALSESTRRLHLALVDHAEALRVARKPGYRARAWADLRAAVALNSPWNDPGRIRTEALGCLGDPIGLDPIGLDHEPWPKVARAPEALQRRTSERKLSGFLVAATPDGEHVAIWCPFARSIAARRKNETDFTTTESPLGYIHDLKFAPDGRLLVAGCDEGFAVWTVPHLAHPFCFRGGTTKSVAIHPHGRLLAVASRQLELWSLASNRLLASFPIPVQAATVEFSADGKYLLAVARDQIAAAWPISGTPEKLYLDGHHGGVPAVAFSPDGRRLASVSKDLAVKLWDAGSGELLHVCTGHAMPVEAVSFSPDGKVLATGDFEGVVRLWDAETGENLAQVGSGATPGGIWRLQFDPAGEFLVAGGAAGIAGWVMDKGDRVIAPEPFFWLQWPGVYDLAIHPRSRELVFLDQSGRICGYDLMHAAGPWTIPVAPGPQVRGLHFDPAGQSLFYLTSSNTIGVWKWHEATRAGDANQKAFHLAISGDGHWIATTSPAHEVVVYDRESEEPLYKLPAESSEVWSLAWSPDGTHVAASLSDGGVVIWNLDRVRTQLVELNIALPSTRTLVTPSVVEPASIEQMVRLIQFRDRVYAARAGRQDPPSPADAAAVRESLREALDHWEHRAWHKDQVWDYHHGRAWIHLLLAIACRLGQDFDAARRYQDEANLRYEQLVGFFKNYAPYRTGLALACFHDAALLEATGHHGDAAKALRKATGLDAANAEAQHGLARLLATSKDPELQDTPEAVARARKAVELAPKNASYWSTLALAQFSAGDWRAAASAIKNAIMLSEAASHDGTGGRKEK